jgi:hypothetical protein
MIALTPMELQLWSEVALDWKRTLNKEMDLRKNRYGGRLKMESRHFPVSLCTWLWAFFGQSKETPKLVFEDLEIHKLNTLFGAGVFNKSGWCHERREDGETWLVQAVEITFVNGTLKIKFDTDVLNPNGVSYHVK